MGEESLVSEQESETFKFLDILDAGKYKPSMVIWHFFVDENRWRLLLAGPSFDKLLPKEQFQGYMKISEALAKANVQSLSVSDIELTRTDYPIFNVARTLINTGPDGRLRAHFKDNWISGIYVKDMVVIRSN